MKHATFESFKAEKLAMGYDEVLTREWAPHLENTTHEHPFDSDVFVAQGELWLTIQGQTQHYKAGDHFEVARHLPHAEKYGSEGALFWAARKN